jgi:molecular chaperone GrpE
MSNIPDQNSQASSPEFDPHGAAAPDGAGNVDPGSLLRKVETEAAEFKDAWLRAKAETDNVRKQGQNDVAKAHKYAIERFAQELLPVKDALEQALATPVATTDTLRDGVALTLKNLQAAFDKAQIVDVNPLGEKYDPHRHQAMTMIESDKPAGSVLQVFQKGYVLNDRLLRPALVAVAKAQAGAPAGPAGA